MKVSLNWVQQYTDVDLSKAGKAKLLEKIGSQLGAIDEVIAWKDDTIIDIENKMFTHRPDAFGILGIAREIAGIQHRPFESPPWYTQALDLSAAKVKLPLDIKNEAPTLVPRFMAVAISDVTIRPSPEWMQSYLTRVGIKPINNVVDVTNYVMYLTGQPLHAFDYDKLAALDGAQSATIIARKAKKGERIQLLNGTEYTLESGTLVLSSQKRPVDIAGIMGGKETEVGSSTKRLVLTCANFDMYSIRRASMNYGVFTDAVTRFNKGQSPYVNDKVLAFAASLVLEHGRGELASKVFDEKGKLPARKGVKVTADFVNERLGLKLTVKEMQTLLQNVEFEVAVQGETLRLLAPEWRTDIHIPEDIVEEVGRLHGYDQLPLELPQRTTKPTKRDELLDFKHELREVLSRAGANEVLTYSFVHGDLMRKVGQDPDQAYQLTNALSPELQYYRMSLTPSLLDKIHMNVRAGYNEFAIFEIGKAHVKGHMDAKDKGLPAEEERLALVFTDKSESAAYFKARKYLDYLLEELGIEAEYIESTHHDPKRPEGQQTLAPYERKRAAYVKVSGNLVGVIGELAATARQNLKLPAGTAAFEIDAFKLLEHRARQPAYRPLPDFPKVTQDMTLKVPSTTAAGEVVKFVNYRIKEESKNSRSDLQVLDIYQSPKDTKHRNVTFRLEIASYERTMTSDEVNALLDKVAAAAGKQLKATRI